MYSASYLVCPLLGFSWNLPFSVAKELQYVWSLNLVCKFVCHFWYYVPSLKPINYCPLNYLQKYKLHKMQKFQNVIQNCSLRRELWRYILWFAGIENITIWLHLCEVAILNGRSFGYSRPNTFGPQIPQVCLCSRFLAMLGGFSVLTWNTEN